MNTVLADKIHSNIFRAIFCTPGMAPIILEEILRVKVAYNQILYNSHYTWFVKGFYQNKCCTCFHK